MTDAESTSAALRRVEQERDELSATLDKVAAENTRLLKDRDAGKKAHGGVVETANMRTGQLIAARRHVDEARTEADAVRAARDNLDHELSAAKKRIAELEHERTTDAYP